MKIIDNFLDEDSFKKIKNTKESNFLPWFYQKNISGLDTEEDCYFVHFLYNKDAVHSSDYPIVKPILKKLKYRSLMRIKCNMYIKSDKIKKHQPHQDFTFKHLGAIYYVNSNNGFTIIGNKKVESIENRLLMFDPSVKHQSTNCSDKRVRLNINFNYL